MKKTILFFVILLGFIAASTTVSAQCADAAVHNNTAYSMDVTIYDQCSNSTATVTIAPNTSYIFTMPSALCAMQSGNIYLATGPCAGNHPICPPSSSPCSACSFPNLIGITTTVVNHLPPATGCHYDIVIR